MPNLPERKESPIMGSAGVGGGVGSNLVGGKGLFDASKYVDGLFSTYVYQGNSTAGTDIKNDIDLTKDGLVWIKKYTGADNHLLQDTSSTSSFGSTTESNGTASWVTGNNNGITSFNNDGFTLGGGAWGSNANGENIVSWTFRKREKFFDIVHFTQGTSDQTISHNLNAVPKMIVLTCKSSGTNWWTYTQPGGTWNYVKLNSTDQNTSLGYDGWNPIDANSFTFKPSVWGTSTDAEWTAYLWASDEAVFGENEDQSICKVGGYTGTGGNNHIDLGWKPQYIMFKRLNGASYWYILDCRRGFNVSGMEDSYLASQNTNGTAGYDFGYPVSDGFHWTENNADFNGNGDSYMYLAIRDVDGLVGKPAQVGEDCFNVDFGNGVGGNINNPPFSTKGSLGNTPNGWPSEITIDTKWDSGTNNHKHWTSPMFANTANGNYFTSTSQDAWANWAGYDCDTSVGAVPGSARTSDEIAYMWKRGKGAQCVYYKGTGGTNNVKHNMGVAPEFILVKRVTQEAWETYHAYGNNSVTPWLGFFKAGEDWGWQSDGGARFGAQPTATTFTVTNDNGTNNSNYFYVAWCFAPITGISKMGFISGTGALQNIECGFSPRWLLVKRNDSSGDGWFIFDTKRGWGAGSDKWLQWNDLGWGGDIDDGSTPYATGFTLGTSSSWNGSGRNYIYYAHS